MAFFDQKAICRSHLNSFLNQLKQLENLFLWVIHPLHAIPDGLDSQHNIRIFQFHHNMWVVLVLSTRCHDAAFEKFSL